MQPNNDLPLALAFALAFALCAIACRSGEVKPVDLYPEDMCAHCRMQISDQRFACEVVTSGGEAYKFDDIGCMEQYLAGNGKAIAAAGVFYKDYSSRAWLSAASVTIVQTGLMTPMGSGKVAFSCKKEAEEFRRQHPPAPDDSDARQPS